MRCGECKRELNDRTDVRLSIHGGPELCSWPCVITWRTKNGAC